MQEVQAEESWYIRMYWWCLIGIATGLLMGLLLGGMIFQR